MTDSAKSGAMGPDFSEKIACDEALDTSEVSSYVSNGYHTLEERRSFLETGEDNDYPTVAELLKNRHWILVNREPQEGLTKEGRRVTIKTSRNMTVQSAIDYTRWVHKNIEEKRGDKYKEEPDESLLWDYIVVNWIDIADDVIKTQLTEKAQNRTTMKTDAEEKPQTTMEVDSSAVFALLPLDLYDLDLKWILGRPNYACIPIAQVLRASGETIPNKAESEQAAAIFWMLETKVRHGSEWRDRGAEELRDMRANAEERQCHE